MKLHERFLAACAALSLIGLAGCGGGGTVTSPVPQPTPPPPTLLSRIVGIGDSLTAGMQGDGLLGDVTGTSPTSPFPGGAVIPTQENGWFALLYEQATGMPPSAMVAPQTSVLPLIKYPGLGNLLFPTNNPAVPFAPIKGSVSCDQLNTAAYSLSQLGTVRELTSANVLDLGVPGITAHEAIAMTQPISPSCQTIPGTPAAIANLQAAVNSESLMFYPVLGGYAGIVQPLTELNVALYLHPTLATVWLGANDLLKYAFSAGQAQFVDTPQQMQSDITTIIQKLQAEGAKVVVANLPNILETPQFFRGGTPGSPQLCAIQNYLYCAVVNALTPTLGSAGAQAAAQQAVAAVQAVNGVGPNGYLTLVGFQCLLQQLPTGKINLDACGLQSGQQPMAGAGLGSYYLTDSFAATVLSLNNGYNTSIAAAAQTTGAPLVDVHSLIDAIYNGTGPIFQQAASINPPKCCSLVFGGGLVSFDGLHPSDTGYAFIADAFIQTIDTAFGANIPQVSPAGVYNGSPPYLWPDPYAQH
jgi:lysophospholipase L1-like esterase